MTKIISLFILLLLTSCSFLGDSDEVINAKKDLLGDDYIEKQEIKEKDEIIEDIKKDSESSSEGQIVEKKEEEIIKLETNIEYLTEEKYFEIEQLPEIDHSTTGFEIRGVTDLLLDKVVVKFSNIDAGLPNDEYTLKSFKTGDKTFIYRAFKKYDVLGIGINEYIIEAYFGDKISKAKITIELPENIEEIKEKVEIVTKNIGTEENTIFLELPETSDSGKVIMLGEDSFTYADIEGLEVTKNNGVSKLTCDNITDYLLDNYSWPYRNTCRPINTDKGISFYLLRLDGEFYYYEKHFIDHLHGLYGVLELERGEGVNKTNISDKNKEFKEKEFTIVEKTDLLFKNIIK